MAFHLSQGMATILDEETELLNPYRNADPTKALEDQGHQDVIMKHF